MEETTQAPMPEELHREMRETRKEVAAEANAALQEESEEIATEAGVRAGVQVEEAERWAGVNTDDEAIHNVLTRAVAEIHVLDELEKKLKSGRKLRVKLGIDPTGPQLHLGRSVTLHKMRQFQDLGHQVVLIIGDFTALVGDASDKDATRPMLSREQIETNMATYKEQMGKILDLDKVEFRYNSEWLAPLNFNDVIKLASKFTVAQMIQRENFSDRWEQGKPIGMHEVLYPLMQGFDSVAIEADLELGGTDQLFNLMAGRALQADFGQEPQSVLCTMMIEGTDGRKMSTTWGNSIYINDPPREQFGKIMSMRDDIIPVYFEAATQVPMDEVRAAREGLENGTMHPMDAKKRLAWEIVRMYHGEEAANQARTDFELQFQQKALPTQVPLVPVEKAVGARANENGEVGILDMLINTGLAPNRKQAQRLVEQGGVRVNDERVTHRDQLVKPEDGMVVKAGRNFDLWLLFALAVLAAPLWLTVVVTMASILWWVMTFVGLNIAIQPNAAAISDWLIGHGLFATLLVRLATLGILIVWTCHNMLTAESPEVAEKFAVQSVPARVEPAPGLLPGKGETQTAL